MTTEFERLKLMEIESLKKQASETAKAVFDAVMEYLTVDVCSAPACVEKLYRHLVRTAEPIILAAMGYEFEELLLESDSHPGRAA